MTTKKDIFTTSGAKVYYYIPKGTAIYTADDARPEPCISGVSDAPQYIQTTSDEAQGEYLLTRRQISDIRNTASGDSAIAANTTGGWSKELVLKEDCRKVTAQEYQNAQAWATATENGMKSCNHNLQEGTLRKTLHDFFYETEPHKLGAGQERPKTSALLTIAAGITITVWLITKYKRTK